MRFLSATFAASATLAACTSLLTWAAWRGIDVSDEAYYVISGLDPFAYRYSITQFGFIWHPFYLATGGNIIAVRLVGLLFLLASATFLATALTQFLQSRLRHDQQSQVTIIITIVAAGAWHFSFGLLTPSYNELNLIGLDLFLGSLLLHASATNAGGPMTWFTPILAGCALTLIALAKPSSAVAAVAMGFWWQAATTSPKPIQATLIAALTSVVSLAVAAWLIDGSLLSFAARVVGALNLPRVGVSDSTFQILLQSIVGFSSTRLVRALIAGIGFALVFLGICAIGFSGLRSMDSRWRTAAPILAALLLCALVTSCRITDLGTTHRTGSFVTFFSALLIFAAVGRELLRERETDTDRSPLMASLLLLVAPGAYSIGTYNLLFLHMSSAALLWIGGALALTQAAPSPTRRSLTGATAFLCCGATVGMLLGAIALPYRLATPLWMQDTPIRIAGGDLLVDPATAAFFIKLRDRAHKCGYLPGTQTLDFTDQGPGVVLALGGRAPGAIWLPLSGEGSIAYTHSVLRAQSRQALRRSWIVTDPRDHSPVVAGLTGELGLDFPRSYEAVAEAHHSALGWHDILWRPRNAASASCSATPSAAVEQE
ncbi:MAG: hypothetical protein ISP45_03235 [Reyranella sp.]|nr:hypothetical protein [Reyranella sp.]